jgi:methionyl-tRNA formyltransferase
MDKPKILWFSANRFGYEVLKASLVINEVTSLAVITLSEKSKTIIYDGIPMGKWHDLKIPVHMVENINDEKEIIKNLFLPDFIIACGWRQMIDESLLKIPKFGAIGFHPTLLPKGRGPAPIINSILNNFRESGVSMFYLTSRVDSGDIIGQERFTIGMDDTASEVYEKVIGCGVKLVKKFLPLLAKNIAPRIPQVESEATFFPPRKLEDNEILPSDSAKVAYAKIRALAKPYRGAYIRRTDGKVIIWKAEFYDDGKP